MILNNILSQHPGIEPKQGHSTSVLVMAQNTNFTCAWVRISQSSYYTFAPLRIFLNINLRHFEEKQ